MYQVVSFYNNKEHSRSIIFGVESVCIVEIHEIVLGIGGQGVLDP